MRPMDIKTDLSESQEAFIERRRSAHEQAAVDAMNDPFIQEIFGLATPPAIRRRKRRAIGHMLKRQAI